MSKTESKTADAAVAAGSVATAASGMAATTGALEIKDTRTGKAYNIPILPAGTEGDTTIRAMDLRPIKVEAGEFGLMTYDPAFMNTASCKRSEEHTSELQSH